MASWLKQGLSTLGEGIATLTKEIISEEPLHEFPRPPSTTPRSSSSTPKPSEDAPVQENIEDIGSEVDVGQFTETIRMLEDKVRSAESQLSNSNTQYQQIIKNYETHMIGMRDQIYELQAQLEQKPKDLPADGTGRDVLDSPHYVDVDLTASSPSPITADSMADTQAIKLGGSSFPVLQPSRSIDEVVNIDTVQALELELQEKDATIRHLTQELSRAKASVGLLESQIPMVDEKVDAEMQTTAVDLFPDLMAEVTEKVDMIVQTDAVQEEHTERILVDNAIQVDQVQDLRDSNSFCLLNLAVNDGSSQTSSSPEMLIPENIDQYTQWEAMEPEVERELPVFREFSEISCQTEVDQEGFMNRSISPIDWERTSSSQQTEYDTQDVTCQTVDARHLFDREMQTEQSESLEEKLSVFADAETQYVGEESHPTWTQTPELQISTQDTQTERVSNEDKGTEPEVFHILTSHMSTMAELPVEGSHQEIQTDFSGGIVSETDYMLLRQSAEGAHAECGQWIATNERLKKEGERLRAHLLSVEQGYAQEFQTVQQREEEKSRLIAELEEQLQATTMTQQQTSTEVKENIVLLQEQLAVLTSARDESMSKLRESEKKNHQLETSLNNIRTAIEHLKKEHRGEIEQERERAKRAGRHLEEKLQDLQAESTRLKESLLEAQREKSAAVQSVLEIQTLKNAVDDLKKQLDEKDVFLNKALDDAATISSNKIDKALIRSMVLGFVAGPKSTQNDILRMLMITLDFSEQDKQRVQNAHTSGLRSLFSGSQKGGIVPDDTFSNMLVKFIEQESQPKSTVTPEAQSFQAQKSPLPSAAGLFSNLPTSSKRTVPVGTTSFAMVSDESTEKQDKVLQKILDEPVSRPSSVDTV